MGQRQTDTGSGDLIVTFHADIADNVSDIDSEIDMIDSRKSITDCSALRALTILLSKKRKDLQ